MGFGNGAFQAARIAIDGFTIIENIQTGKIQASLASTKFKSVNSNPSNGVSWGWADYIVNNSKVTNMASSLEWTGSSDAVSAAVAVNLGTNTTAAIDGFASVNGTDTDTLALTLSTANTNDLILLSVTEDVRANTTTSVTDTAGLTWKKLFVQGSSGANVGIGIYYAIATTALSNDTITVTYTASTSPASAQAMAFGVTNVDTSQPFDPNSTPTGSSLINATILLSGPITTSQSNTVVIDFFAGNNSSTGFTVETQVFSVSNTDGTLTISPSSGNVIASLNLANANTWTAPQTISSLSAGDGNQLIIQNGIGNTVAQFQGGGNQIYTGIGTIPTLSMQDYTSTTLWSIGSADGTGGSDNLHIWNQNTALQLLVLNPSKQKIFGVNNSANSVFTLNNTLDDGSGNVTFTGHLNLTAGTDKTVGQATLSAGTVTVDNTSVTASSLIFLTNAGASGTVGTLSVGTITAGTSFVINSSSSTDTSKVNWLIVN